MTSAPQSPSRRVGLMVAGVALFAASVLSAGCVVDDDLDLEPLQGAVALGGSPGSVSEFIKLDDGEEVVLVPGSQGGYHVWVALKLRGIEGKVTIERDARQLETDHLILRSIPQQLEIPPDSMVDWWMPPAAIPSFMCPAPIGVTVYDSTVELGVRIFGEDDELLAEDRVRVIPRCPEDDGFCLSICAG